MAKNYKRWLAVVGAVALPLALLLVLVQARAQSLDDEDLKMVQGKVQRFTTAPGGEVDGAVLDDGTIVHWPPHLGDKIASIVAKNDRVRANGWMKTGPAGDTHLEIQSITNLRTNVSFDRPDGPPPPRPALRGPRAKLASPDRDSTTAEGKVRSLTTAPRGEVDGAVLGDGTTVHWPPHLGDRIANIVAKGDRVRATGWMETGPEGDTHLEIQSITNLRTNASFDRPDGPLPPRSSARGPRNGNVEERLRTLEDRVDQLVKEVERLRTDR
jgi:hypothetical protein